MKKLNLLLVPGLIGALTLFAGCPDNEIEDPQSQFNGGNGDGNGTTNGGTNGANGTGNGGTTEPLDPDAQELCVHFTIGDGNTFNAALQSLTACSVSDPFPTISADIEADIQESCVPGNFYYDLIKVALDGPRVNIDLAKTRSCVQKGRTARSGGATINDWNNGTGPLFDLFEDPDCAGAITPQVQSGDVCVQGWDCVEGVFCQADPPDNPELRCLAPAGQGAACGGSRFCDESLTCLDEVCTPPSAAGATCDPYGAPCVEGYFCDEGTTVCTASKALGAPCGSDLECADGNWCDLPDDQATDTVCITPPEDVADGATCVPDSDFCAGVCSVCREATQGAGFSCQDRAAEGSYCAGDNDCRGGFICTGTCTPAPTAPEAGVGQACGDAAGGAVCTDGACVLGVCNLGALGDVCEVDFSECQSGLICVGNGQPEGLCSEPPATGNACADGQCAAGDYCTAANLCENLKEAGKDCGGDEECLSGTCLLNGKCAAPGPSCYESPGMFVQMMILGSVFPLLGWRRRRQRRGQGG
jgi:hypothetical protein